MAVLEKSEKRIKGVKEIEEKIEFFVKFVSKKDEGLDRYNKKVKY